MKHRERVVCAINHKEPDRVPIDLWGSDSRLLNDFYFKIIRHLNLEPLKTKVRPGKSAEYVDYRISDCIDSDFRHLVIGTPDNFSSYKDDDENIYDEWGIGYKKKGNFAFVVRHPLQNADLSAIDKYKGPVIRDPGRIRGLKEQAEDWFKNTDYCITTAGPISGFILEFYQYLCGTENFFTDLYLNVKFAEKLIYKLTDIITELYMFFIEPVAPYITWIEFESDFGMQNMPFISKELFAKFLKKPMGMVFSQLKKIAPNAKIFLHSCGSIRELIPDFIDIGVNVLSGLQPLANGMNSAELKKEFGKDLVFHGGVDLQQALWGSANDTIAETKKRISDYGHGGGYIFGPSNHFQIDVPVENFFIMYEKAKEFGTYPLSRKND